MPDRQNEIESSRSPLTHGSLSLSLNGTANWLARYFVPFVYLGVFFLRGIIIATIVSIYLDKTHSQVQKDRRKEWRGLMKAFNLLDIEQKGFITYANWEQLLELLRPKSTATERRFLFNALDREHNGRHVACNT